MEPRNAPAGDQEGGVKEGSEAQSRSRPGSRPFLERIVPPVYLAAEGGGRSFVKACALALVIRLILMPISSHPDLLSTYHRSYLLHTGFVPHWWVPHELIQSAFLVLYSPFLPLAELLGWDGFGSASNDFWLESFAPHPLALLALFLFKMPYLLCDFAVSLVLLRLFVETPAKGLAAAKMWLLNPLTIFSFYVFGRHDAIAILFIALGLLWLDRGQSLRGAFSIGVAIWSRYYAAFLLPFLAALHPGSGWKKAGILAIGLLPIAAFNLLTAVGAPEFEMASVYMVKSARFSNYLLSFDFDIGSHQVLFVFPMLYGMLFLLALVRPQRDRLVVRFSEYAACCLLVLYAAAFFHPHYISWSILFLVILRAEEQGRVLGNFHYLQILLFVPYTFSWGEPLSVWLLAPLNPELFKSLDSPWTLIEAFGDPQVLMDLVRSLMSAVCMFMAGWILFGRPPQEVGSVPVGAGVRPADAGYVE